MAIAIAGIQFPLAKGNGYSKLQVGIARQCSIRSKLRHHYVDLLAVGCAKVLLSNRGIVVKGNEKPKRLYSLTSSTISADTSMESGGTVSSSISLYDPTLEDRIEMAIFNCRFLTLMAVVGSLAGSILCFLKGGVYVFDAFKEWFFSCLKNHGTGKVILLLVEALDVYLMGTVMLIFGMGLYGLFISSIEVFAKNSNGQVSETVSGSSLFGLFRLQERPKWLQTQSLEELKSKLGHVIVMILLVGMFDKSKKIHINSSTDLVCFSASILLSSGCLYLLSKLHSEH